MSSTEGKSIREFSEISVRSKYVTFLFAFVALNCSGCKFPITKDLHSALGRKWHRNCFRFTCYWLNIVRRLSPLLNLQFFLCAIYLYRCSECLSTIPLYYIARDNVLYCKRDYILKFGEHCQRCSKQITGPLMVSNRS